MSPPFVCKGKFLVELVDDSVLFVGMWIIFGFFLHAAAVIQGGEALTTDPPLSAQDGDGAAKHATLNKDMTDPMLRRISTIYIRI